MARETSRWTYTAGSRPEGVIIYDNDTKLHSHHDTDPARGQHSAFDLVRLHKFGTLDADVPQGTAVTDRPSYRAMVELVNSLPEVGAARARAELEAPSNAPEGELSESSTAASTGGVVASVASVGAPPTAESNGAGRFAVRSAGDFSDGAPLEWLVRDLLPRAELAVIFGESGSGKSFLALDVCAAITRGIEWRSKRTVRGGVVYVCAEGARGFKKRLRAYAHEHRVELAQLPAVIADAPNLLEPKDAAALTFAICSWVKQAGPIDVVVIDTLAATTPGGNENSGEDIGLVLSHCKLISKQTGALVVLIHHSGKDSTRGERGWSGLRGAADASIEITRNGDYRTATIVKLKDGTDSASFPFKLKIVELGRDSHGEPETSCVIEHVDAQPVEKSTRKAKLGPREQIMFDMLKVMAPSGTVAEEDLVEGYRAKVPRGDGDKDQRRNHARQALTALIAKKMAFKQGEDRVSLTSLVTSGEGGWLE